MDASFTNEGGRHTSEEVSCCWPHLQQPILDAGHVHGAWPTLVLPVIHVMQVHERVHRQGRGLPLRLQVLELQATGGDEIRC